MRIGFFIRPVGYQGVINIGNGHKPAGKRYFFTGKLARISGAVPFLMVRTGQYPRILQKFLLRSVCFDLINYPYAKYRMHFDRLKLFKRQLARLKQYTVRDRYFSDIMQLRRL
jgi:hypothetical protein